MRVGARGQIKIFDKNILTATTTTGDWVHILGLKPPFRLMVRTSNIGTAPVNPSMTVTTDLGIGDMGDPQSSIVDSTLGLDGPAAITSAGAQAAAGDNDTSQLPIWIRGVCVSTFGTVNGGTRVEAWVVGDRG